MPPEKGLSPWKDVPDNNSGPQSIDDMFVVGMQEQTSLCVPLNKSGMYLKIQWQPWYQLSSACSYIFIMDQEMKKRKKYINDKGVYFFIFFDNHTYIQDKNPLSLPANCAWILGCTYIINIITHPSMQVTQSLKGYIHESSGSALVIFLSAV